MSISDKLLQLNTIRKDLFDASKEKGFDTTDATLENLHERWSSVTPVKCQTKVALLDNVDVAILPDSGYNALDKVIVETPSTLLPENIREGITIFGVTGTMRVPPSNAIPEEFRSVDPENPDPGSLEEALAIYHEHYGEFDGDIFLHVDNEDRRCYGFIQPEGSSGQKLYADTMLVPAIDEVWDPELYPYAFLEANYYSGRDLYSKRIRLELFGQNSGYTVTYSSNIETYIIEWSYKRTRQYELVDGAWVLVYEKNKAGNANVVESSVVWANRSYSYKGAELIPAGAEGVPCADFVIPVYDAQTTVFQPIGLRVLVFNAGKYGRYKQGSWWRFDFTHVRTDHQETTLRIGFDLSTNQIISCGRTLMHNDEEIWPNRSKIEEASL